jgi:hypothetical protein
VRRNEDEYNIHQERLKHIFKRLGLLVILFFGTASAGINWIGVWLEPRTSFLTLTAGEWRAYTVMGETGTNTKAELTRSPFLKIVSSDTNVVQIDRTLGMFIAKAAGKAEVSIAFSEARATVPVIVKDRHADATTGPKAK